MLVGGETCIYVCTGRGSRFQWVTLGPNAKCSKSTFSESPTLKDPTGRKDSYAPAPFSMPACVYSLATWYGQQGEQGVQL
jgi:hypothetical protein